ncbi:TPA: cell division protein ZapB [bacterium]|nr:cell division protein ZapB [bacterium]
MEIYVMLDDSIDLLRKRVQQAIGLIEKLKDENIRLKEHIAKLEEEIFSLKEEAKVLKNEREQIRSKIDAATSMLDTLGIEEEKLNKSNE